MGRGWYSAYSVLQNPTHSHLCTAYHGLLIGPLSSSFWLKFCLRFSSVHITCPGEMDSLNNPPPNQETRLWPHHSSIWNHCHTVKFKIIWYWKSLCHKKFGVMNWFLCKIWGSHSSVGDLSLLGHDAVSTDVLVGEDVPLFEHQTADTWHSEGIVQFFLSPPHLDWPVTHPASYQFILAALSLEVQQLEHEGDHFNSFWC